MRIVIFYLFIIKIGITLSFVRFPMKSIGIKSSTISIPSNNAVFNVIMSEFWLDIEDLYFVWLLRACHKSLKSGRNNPLSHPVCLKCCLVLDTWSTFCIESLQGRPFLKKCWCQLWESDIWGSGHSIDFQSTHRSHSLLCVKLFKNSEFSKDKLYPPTVADNLPMSLSIVQQIFHTYRYSAVLVKWVFPPISSTPRDWKGFRMEPQGMTHYPHREGLYHYHNVLVNGPFLLLSPSNLIFFFYHTMDFLLQPSW